MVVGDFIFHGHNPSKQPGPPSRRGGTLIMVCPCFLTGVTFGGNTFSKDRIVNGLLYSFILSNKNWIWTSSFLTNNCVS